MLNLIPSKFILTSLAGHTALLSVFFFTGTFDPLGVLSLADTDSQGSIELLFEHQTEAVKKEIKKILDKKVTREIVDLGELPAEEETEEQQVHKVSLEDLKAVNNMSPEWKAFLRSLKAEISKRQRYPYSARRLRQTGKVLIEFDVYSNGLIKNVIIKKHSEYAKLDDSAFELISSIPKVANFPKKIEKSDKISITVPIEYTL